MTFRDWLGSLLNRFATLLHSCPLLLHPGDRGLAEGRTSNHDDGGNRDNHHYLKSFEAFFITVEPADGIGEFRNHLSKSFQNGELFKILRVLSWSREQSLLRPQR